jgi:hypothetical protein
MPITRSIYGAVDNTRILRIVKEYLERRSTLQNVTWNGGIHENKATSAQIR